MPHIYKAIMPNRLWGSSGDANLQTDAGDPGIALGYPLCVTLEGLAHMLLEDHLTNTKRCKKPEI